MANRVLVNENSLADIAAAIREKTGNTEASFTPGQMGDAIRAIEAGGGSTEPVIRYKKIVHNGTYEVPEGVDGFNPVEVDIRPSIAPITITTNGTFEINSEVIDGYGPVTVNVQPKLETITITENGTYKPGYLKDGFSQVEVNVPTSGGGGGADLPEEAYTLSGNSYYTFYGGNWDWFINEYGNKITTSELETCSNMFNGSLVEEIPFELNFRNYAANGYSTSSMFKDMINLKSIPKINNLKANDFGEMFAGCRSIREYPEDMDSWFDWSYMDTKGSMDKVFSNNWSLRKLPLDVLNHGNPSAAYYDASYSNLAYACYSLDEIIGIPFPNLNATWTSNAFGNSFNSCSRIKEATFALQDDGSPYTVNWSKQAIDLSKDVGWATGSATSNSIIRSNSGITPDNAVSTDADYQAKKNDADWFTCNPDYSRYNHTSAVNTINSLPITTGTGNTIKFKGAQGGKTDGGAISNLTEEEIAVAAAKGWTVSLA